MTAHLLVALALLVPVLGSSASAWLAARRLGRATALSAAWCCAVVVPVAAGAVLSKVGLVGSTPAWAGAVGVFSLIVVFASRWLRVASGPAGDASDPGSVGEAAADEASVASAASTASYAQTDAVRRRVRVVAALLGLGAALAWLPSLLALPWSTPWQYDSLTYHLPRVVHAWQVGTFDFGCTSFWAQWMQPWGISALQLWWLQIAAFRDAFLPLLSVCAALVTAALCAAWLGELGAGRGARVVAGLVVLATPTVLMQAFTTMPEAPTTATLVASLYLGVRALRAGSERSVAASVVAFALAATLKAFALMALPLLGAMWVAVMWRVRGWPPRQRLPVVAWLAVAVVSGLLLGLGTGYGSNLRAYGHPLGSVRVRSEHTYAAIPGGRSVSAIASNTARFAMEWLTPDGLPTGISLDERIGPLGEELDTVLGAPIIGTAYARHPFRSGRTITPRSQEELTWPGVAAWWVTLAAALIIALRVRGEPRVVLLLLAGWGAAQVLSGPWDPWRGRYMVPAVALGALLVGVTLPRLVARPAGFALAALLAGLLGLSAVNASWNREGRPLVANIQRDGYGALHPWPWQADRLRQLTAQKRWLGVAARSVEAVLPDGAEVALAFHERDAADYVFMGPPWRHRRIHWSWCEETRELDLPPSATHLLYELGAIEPQAGDLRVARNIILRVLPAVQKLE